MRLRPRYSLKTVFVLVTMCAIVLAWGHSYRVWIEERHKFIDYELPQDGRRWAHGFDTERWHVDIDNERSELPWSLWVWGETMNVRSFIVNDGRPSEEFAKTKAQIKRLFPEAEITSQAFD
jgi:hypothetical protein